MCNRNLFIQNLCRVWFVHSNPMCDGIVKNFPHINPYFLTRQNSNCFVFFFIRAHMIHKRIALICLFFYRLNSSNLCWCFGSIEILYWNQFLHMFARDTFLSFFFGADTENLQLNQLYNWSVYDKVISRNFTSLFFLLLLHTMHFIRNEERIEKNEPAQNRRATKNER